MPNIGGRRKAKRKLVGSVAHSKLLYAVPIGASAIDNHVVSRKLSSAQNDIVLRSISAYRTVSTSPVLILTNVSPTEILANDKQEAF